MTDNNFNIDPIGIIQTPFKEKFGIPRQSGLAETVNGKIIIQAPYDDPLMFEGLTDFSHIWLTFVFHDVIAQGWKKRVRPPRLGGNEKKGIFSTRSPFRPNFLGLSSVRLIDIDITEGVCLHVSGVDLLDQTPIIDIKPYIPYADAIVDANGGFAEDAPNKKYDVEFSTDAKAILAGLTNTEELVLLIRDVISFDPRPAFHEDDAQRHYHMRLADIDVTWVIKDNVALIIKITE